MSRLTYRAVIECLNCDLHDNFTDWDGETKIWCTKFDKEVPSHGFCMWGLAKTTGEKEDGKNC